MASPLDPLLAPLADNGGPTQTHALLPGSPAIDQANSVLTTDQRGLPKPVDFATIANHPQAGGGAGSDLGAYEAQNVTLSWDGGAGTNLAFDAGNWDPNQSPTPFQVVDLDDALGSAQTIDLDGRTLQLIRIELDDAPDDYTFTGGEIEIFLTGGNALLTRGGGGTLTIDSDILFGAGSVDPRFNVDTTAPPIVVTGNVAPAPLRTDAMTLELTSRNLNLLETVTVSGIISDGLGGAQLSLRAGFGPDAFNHRGVVVVTGDNTFSGTTTVHGATLVFDSIANADGAASALGAPVNATDGTIRLGADSVPGTLRYTGAGHSSDRVIELAGAGGILEAHASATGGLELSGGVMPVASPQVARTLELTGDSSFVNTISGDIVDGSSQAINILKTGSTTWVIAGNNSLEGDTTISAGTLLLDATGLTDLGNTITVESGATFGGEGDVGGAVTMQSLSTLSPGNRIGTLSVGHVAMSASDAQLRVDIGGTAPGSGHDQLVVNGSASISGELHVDLDDFLPSNSDSFVIVTSGNLVGGFSNLDAGRVTTTDGLGSFLVTFGTGGAHEVVLSDFQLDPLAGDYDGDNDVDGRDFLIWQRGFSPNPISSLDLNVWQTNFGNQASPLATAQTPALPIAAATGELIDAAIAYMMGIEPTDDSTTTVNEPLVVDFSESSPAPSEQLSTAKPTSDDEPEFVTANSDESDESADQWLSDELLERVFG